MEELERSLADTAAELTNAMLAVFNRKRSTSFTYKDVITTTGSIWPSNNLIRELFLLHFNSNKENYRQTMVDISASVISMDHTFKVSCNIGTTGADGVWVPMYENLFIVLNERGQVMDYRLNKSTAFTHIEDIVVNLRDRLLSQNVAELLVMLDNCCHWQNKMTSALLPIKTAIKLDIFHALKRVTSTIPKTSPYRTEIVHQFRMFLRSTCDEKNTRSMTTPCAEVQNEKLSHFNRIWLNKVDRDGHPVLNMATKNAIGSLTRHVVRGCLSDIPPGIGTNKNERLHRLLNQSALCVSRIGPEIAEAILAVTFYRWNKNRLNTGEYVPILPVSQNIVRPAENANTRPVPHTAHATETNNIDTKKAEYLSKIFLRLRNKFLINNDHFAIRSVLLKKTQEKLILSSEIDIAVAAAKYGYSVQDQGTMYELFHMPYEHVQKSYSHQLQTLSNCVSRPVIIICGSSFSMPFAVYIPVDLEAFDDMLFLGVVCTLGVPTFYLLTESEGGAVAGAKHTLSPTCSPPQNLKSCRCGVNDTSNRITCNGGRCPCHSSKIACVYACRCHECGNAYGKKKSCTVLHQVRRSKLESRRLLSYCSSPMYVKEKSLNSGGGRWNICEIVALVLIYKHTKSTVQICKTFKLVQQSAGGSITFNKKSRRQIIAKLTHIKDKHEEMKLLMNDILLP